MPIIDIECPTGLKGKVRGLEGIDGRFLTNRSLVRKGLLLDHILSNCWIETIDPGIYKASAGGALNWGQVLQGDRMYALLQIRIAGSQGSDFEFSTQCKNRACREKFPWEIDLEDLPIKLLDEEVKAKLAAGENRFETRVPGTEERKQLQAGDRDSRGIILRKSKSEIIPNTGQRIWFSLPTGSDEAKMAKITRQNPALKENELVTSIAMRVAEVEGVEFKKGKRIESALEYLETVGLQDLAVLLDRFDEVDCGVDTVIEVECPHCQNLMDVDLPFDENFFFKRTRRVVR